ncbi:MAG: phosphatase PAP2 family protein [Patescibacteria group bacterium]|nr:phosphatase PAP2 family protein [Patescibacteria group bacterium]
MDTFFVTCAQYLCILPLVVLGVYFLMQPREDWKHLAVFAVSAALLAYAVGVIAGLLYYDPRPFVVGHFTPLIPHAPDNGFPSDHALLVSAIAMIGTIWNKKLGLRLWVLAMLVAIARVYVGVHHTIDVAGSFVISIVTISVMAVIFKRFLEKSKMLNT